jgi:hypothetical protein
MNYQAFLNNGYVEKLIFKKIYLKHMFYCHKE